LTSTEKITRVCGRRVGRRGRKTFVAALNGRRIAFVKFVVYVHLVVKFGAQSGASSCGADADVDGLARSSAP
jgi:hypothetical protein